MNPRLNAWVAVGLLTLSGSLAAEDRRARLDYMLHCQGCHGATGAGLPGGEVPNMSGEVGKFLRVDGGREYLVQVPGSANSAIDDPALAAVLNFILQTMSADELPEDFAPYTAAEVGELRKTPTTEVAKLRVELLSQLNDDQGD